MSCLAVCWNEITLDLSHIFTYTVTAWLLESWYKGIGQTDLRCHGFCNTSTKLELEVTIAIFRVSYVGEQLYSIMKISSMDGI